MDKENPIYIIKHTDNMFTEVFEGANCLSYIINIDNKRVFTFGGVGCKRKSINTSYFAIKKYHVSWECLWTKDKRQQLVDFHRTYYNYEFEE